MSADLSVGVADPLPLPLSELELLGNLPVEQVVPTRAVAKAVREAGRRLVVLDDDPTGTQTVAGVPVLTRWREDDLRWAFRQPSRAFYILTNSRSLAPEEMARTNREVISALVAAARAENAGFVVASRSDSTLRGHYPYETDVIAEALLEQTGRPIDGVVIVPAYLEAGRLTVSATHWMRTPAGFIGVGQSEFARDATFGYESSDLRDYVVEKSQGRWSHDQVATILLEDLRVGGRARVAEILGGLTGGCPVVVDAVTENDLRVLALGIIDAEKRGASLLYRVGPSFVRARAGFQAREPMSDRELAVAGLRPDTPRHGLVVVGSHVPRTTQQLEHLLATDGVTRIDLDVAQLLGPQSRAAAISAATAAVVEALASSDVVLSTSRTVVTADDVHGSLEIARSVSAGVVEVVTAAVREARPGWVVGKGGITSSDVATKALGITRAWVRGTLLPGIVSLWRPVDPGAGPSAFVVFAGNVGDEHALVDVVARLRGAA